MIVRTGIGIDNVDANAAAERGVVFCNTPDGPTESTAEHAVALLMGQLIATLERPRSPLPLPGERLPIPPAAGRPSPG